MQMGHGWPKVNVLGGWVMVHEVHYFTLYTFYIFKICHNKTFFKLYDYNQLKYVCIKQRLGENIKMKSYDSFQISRTMSELFFLIAFNIFLIFFNIRKTKANSLSLCEGKEQWCVGAGL